MKKIVIAAIVVGSLHNLFAQSDGFFRFRYEESLDAANVEWVEMPMLPDAHGLDYNYLADNVPIGSGVMLFVGLGLMYANHKRR